MIDWLGNATTLGPARWHPEPTSRGTFSILSTCVATLILCTWTAVHLNVPEHGKEHRQKWHRLGWLIAGLLAPEFVAWNAWEQRRKVKELTKDMRQAFRERHGLKEKLADGILERLVLKPMRWLYKIWDKTLVTLLVRPDDLEELRTEQKLDDVRFWTDTHSWLVVAGGVVFDTTTAEESFLPFGRTQLTLTSSGIKRLFQRRAVLLPKLNVQDIRVKSSSDGFMKLITCAQAAWFCLQCITRLASGLPISLLELSVSAHAMCCLITYSIWWHKPKDIADPARIMGAEANSVAALMCNDSLCGLQLIEELSESVIVSQWRLAQSASSTRLSESRCEVQVHRLRDLTAPSGLLINGKLWSLMPVDRGLERRYGRPPPLGSTMVTIDRSTIRRLQIIRPDDCDRSRKFFSWHEVLDLVHTHSPNLAIDSIEDIDKSVYLCLITATFLYGGIHAVAWAAAFPAQWQSVLWRTATISVMAFGPLYPAIIWTMGQCEYMNMAIRFILRLFFGLAIIWYCLCRGYLVIESFAMLAYLQPEMLELPNWTTYFPHIS